MLPKKLRISLVFLLLLFFSSVRLTFAQEEKSWAVQSPEDFASCLDGTFTNQEVCGEAYSGMFIPMNLIYGSNCLLAGVGCSNDDLRSEEFFNRSALSQTGNLIGSLYLNPPANTGIWLADVASNIGVIPKAYAQGIGFSALQPLLGLWKVMRNITYTLLILILLIIGLMIMFRTKIDPRTVISVQSAIPRVIITLILITFSYPIAGVMVDLMYLVLFLGISIIGPIIPNATETTVTGLQAEFATGGGLFRILGSIPNAIKTEGIISIIGFVSLPLLAGGKVLTGLKGFLSGLTQAGSKAAVAANLGKGALAGIFGLGGIVFLLVIIAFIFALIRIFFILLNSYIQIIISVIFAPILLLGQAIPGQNSFSSWLKNLLANLVVFPTTAILILVADIVSQEFYKGKTPDLLWVPPLIGSWGSSVGGILIPLGFALVIPQIVVSVKNLFKAKPAVPVGLGTITGPILGGATQALQYIYYGQQLFRKRETAQPVGPIASEPGKKAG